MKNVETSYSKKENKKNGEIRFEKFPGDTKKEINKILIEKPKKTAWVFIIIILYIILFIISGFLNKKILDETDDTYYKLVNHYDGKYANISLKKRSTLFKEIGFDVSKEEERKLNDETYAATYAYHKHEIDDDIYDTISVYYDKDNNVYYLTANLVYDNKISVKNINNLLNNFTKVKINNEAIKKLMGKGHYYDDKVGLKISMYLNDSKIKDHKVITIVMQR